MNTHSNFGGLVLGCIEADFCNQTFILHHVEDLQDLHTFAVLPNQCLVIVRRKTNDSGEIQKYCKIPEDSQDVCQICQVFENTIKWFCRSTKILQDEYSVAKIGPNTSENGQFFK